MILARPPTTSSSRLTDQPELVARTEYAVERGESSDLLFLMVRPFNRQGEPIESKEDSVCLGLIYSRNPARRIPASVPANHPVRDELDEMIAEWEAKN